MYNLKLLTICAIKQQQQIVINFNYLIHVKGKTPTDFFCNESACLLAVFFLFLYLLNKCINHVLPKEIKLMKREKNKKIKKKTPNTTIKLSTKIHVFFIEILPKEFIHHLCCSCLLI